MRDEVDAGGARAGRGSFSLKYAFVFGAFAGLLTLLAFQLRGWAWALCWPAVSFAGVALAYSGAGPAVFGKCADGRMRPWAVVVLLPYLLLSWMTWGLARRLSREPSHAEVAPGLFIGRRVLPGELPFRPRTVVDLTSEFFEPAPLRDVEHYVSLPILDGMAPEPVFLAEHIERCARLPTPLYVHCAQGHGRTGLVAAALLVARGLSPEVTSALEQVRGVRPGVRLSAEQRAVLGVLGARLARSGVPASHGEAPRD
ncbi:tyrosine-protein phosphatase [Myxococcus fulvus]|uniref:phosphatase domain-containing protein n=1 Tax=Myxococcus fulvus TaxID=33 RepID=UPI003B9DA68D